jgi:hypothetical protein
MAALPHSSEPATAPGAMDSKSIVPLFAIAVLAWALDFKAQASGGAAGFQMLLLAMYLGAALWIIVSAVRAGVSVGSVWVLIVAVAMFMGDSALIGLGANQLSYAIIVNLIPPFIYLSACVLTYIALSVGKDRLGSILTVLRLACLAFAAGHLAMITLSHGIDVTQSRFEVLSGAVTPALGILALSLVLRISALDVGVMLFNLLITLLSVTRTLFAVLAVQLLSVFIASPRTLFKRTTLRGILLLIVSGMVVAGIDYAAGTGLVDRWVNRLTVSARMGADPTALTRNAETNFMMDSFMSSPGAFLFGNGLAAETSLTGPDAKRAAELVGWQSVDFHSVGYGHENYASILFTAGLLGGGALLVMQILNALWAVGLLRRIQLSADSFSEPIAHLGAWGALIVIGVAAYGLFGAVIGDRSTCVWYGIGTGMLYWARDALPARQRAVVPASRFPMAAVKKPAG